uniref:Uncharacterized protein n=1 Tax=Angiostrongylus cantonensis TaxID=6313 RepID=A0A0K0DL34_ANGCA
MSLSEYITNCDDMEEKLSANEFIKTLKKFHLQYQESSTLTTRSLTTCSRSPENWNISGSELLVKMRSRFQHRATEPLFHSLPNASEVRYVLMKRLYSFSIAFTNVRPDSLLVHTRRTDSAPIISRSPHRKYVQDFSSNSDLFQL